MKQQEINGVAETDVRGMLKDDYDKLAYRLREQNKAYNDFCEQNGLQKQYDRIKVGGFKKSSPVLQMEQLQDMRINRLIYL